MKIYITLALCCFIQCFAHAQNTLQFNNFSPLWSHYASTTSVDDSIKKFTSVKPLIYNKSIYFTHNLFDDVYYAGHLTERVNFVTGGKKWSYHYYADDFVSREYAESPYIENGDLSLLVFRENNHELDLSAANQWLNGDPLKRRIDINNGILLDSTLIDPTLAVLWIPARRTYEDAYTSRNYHTSSLYPHGTSYQYFMGIGTFIGISRFEAIEFTDTSDVNETQIYKWLNRNVLPYHCESHNKIDINNDSLYIVRHFVELEEKLSPFIVKLECMTRNLDVVQDYDITEYVEVSDHFKLVYADETDILLMGKRIVWEGDTSVNCQNCYSNYDFYHFNSLGKLLEKTTITNDSKYIKVKSATILKGSKKMLIVGSDIEGEFQKLFFEKSTGNGELYTLKEFTSKKADDRFDCEQIFQVENDNLLINLSHSSTLIDEEIQKSVWMMMSNESLDLYLDNISLEEDRSEKILLSPNPTSGFITIEDGDIKWSNVVAHNAFGQQVMDWPYCNTIDLSSFVGGVYYLEFRDKFGYVVEMKKIIKL